MSDTRQKILVRLYPGELEIIIGLIIYFIAAIMYLIKASVKGVFSRW